MKLLFSALIKYIFGILIVGALVFLPAGTLNYMGGILFMVLLFVPVLVLGIVLFLKAPNLLRKRLDGKETDKTQRGVIAFSGVIFILVFITAGLDFRFGWSNIPSLVTIISSVIFILSYLLYGEVMRENAYLSRKIEVTENQTVISTGLYAVVRHPMYAATVLMFLMIPLILGSSASLLIFLAYPFVIAVRINGEEKLLSEQLPGYKEYKQKVKYRLIPFVW